MRYGDESKKPVECEYKESAKHGLLDAHCPNLKEVGGGMSGERYRCDLCGYSFFLDYEEMK
jgi:hypothetical protein